MLKPFHLSFVAPDLEKCRAFYIDLLGCKLGRDQGDWIDILLFGHQITIHQKNASLKPMPIDHFGPVLDKVEWEALAKNIHESKLNFVTEPFIVNHDNGNESGKCLLHDPAGNLLEFKFYNNFTNTVKN